MRFLLPDTDTPITIPLFSMPVAAGFPSPADDHIETKLDLNHHLIKHPAATFMVRAQGDSMTGAGIHHNDLLVVDRSLTAHDKSIVIAIVNGEFTVKRLRKFDDRLILQPENPTYRPLIIQAEMDFEVWGVVTSVIHPLA